MSDIPRPRFTAALHAAIASARPNVPSSPAEMCPTEPSPRAQMCRNVPSPPPATPQKCAAERRDVPESAKNDPTFKNAKTNPRELGQSDNCKSLNDRQLAAARLLVCGWPTTSIARRLAVNHHTIARWKRLPNFIAELQALRARAAAVAVTNVSQQQQ